MNGLRQDNNGAPKVGRPVSLAPLSRVDPAADTFAPLILDVLADRRGSRPEETQLSAIGALMRLHRIAGIGFEWAKRGGDDTAPLASALEGSYRRNQLEGAMIQESTDRALDALGSVAIPALVFKGAALVRCGLYGIGERPMDDADLLVPPGRAREAARVLCDAGFTPWRPWEEEHEVWSDTFTLRDARGPDAFPCDVDLHWRTEYGSLRFGSGGSVLWQRSDSATSLPAHEEHLLVVAEHFLKHLRVRPHLLAYADLCRLCAAVESWKTFVTLARARWWTAAVGLLLEVLREDLGAQVPEAVSTQLIATRPAVRKRRAILRPTAHLGRGFSVEGRISGMGQRWGLGPGSAGVLRDVWDATFPPQIWLRARYGSGPATRLRLKHGVAVLKWVSGGGPSPLSPNQEAP